MIAANHSILTLNLSCNRLHDIRALDFISSLKSNKRLTSMPLGNNPIELKHVRGIEKFLRLNRGLAKSHIVPAYRRQLDRIRVNPADFNVTQRKIQEIGYACQTEKAVIVVREEKLQETLESEKALSRRFEEAKAQVDSQLARADQRLVVADELSQAKKLESEKSLLHITKKMAENKRVVEKIGEDSTNSALYSPG